MHGDAEVVHARQRLGVEHEPAHQTDDRRHRGPGRHRQRGHFGHAPARGAQGPQLAGIERIHRQAEHGVGDERHRADHRGGDGGAKHRGGGEGLVHEHPPPRAIAGGITSLDVLVVHEAKAGVALCRGDHRIDQSLQTRCVKTQAGRNHIHIKLRAPPGSN